MNTKNTTTTGFPFSISNYLEHQGEAGLVQALVQARGQEQESVRERGSEQEQVQIQHRR
jgi:hypothetical protein